METHDQDATAAEPSLLEDPRIDLRGAVRAALGSAFLAGLVGGGLYILGKLSDSYAARVAEESAKREATVADASENDAPSEEAVKAATLLGVSVDASADEIRAALRTKLGASGIHPDHGGDGEEARRLIDAKNLLIENLREEKSQ